MPSRWELCTGSTSAVHMCCTIFLNSWAYLFFWIVVPVNFSKKKLFFSQDNKFGMC